MSATAESVVDSPPDENTTAEEPCQLSGRITCNCCLIRLIYASSVGLWLAMYVSYDFDLGISKAQNGVFYDRKRDEMPASVSRTLELY